MAAFTRRAALGMGFGGALFGLGGLAAVRRRRGAPAARIEPFALAALPGLTAANGFPVKGFGEADLRGRTTLVVLFASWCPECRAEHPRLLDLAAAARAPIYGVLSRDKPEAGARFLTARGNPFRAVGEDRGGAFGRAVGAPGVPFTLIVAPDLRIARAYAGALGDDLVRSEILPLLGRA